MKNLLIAVVSERSSAYGRGFIEGIASFSEKKQSWEPTLVNADKISIRQAKAYDGWICRTANDKAIDIIKRCRKPTVDALCTKPNTGFAKMRSAPEPIGKLVADHFLSRRFSHIAFCGYRGVLFSDRRRNAFAHELEARGIRPFIYRQPYAPLQRITENVLIGDSIETPPDAADLTSWIERLPKPVAIFCCDDIRASHVIAICKKMSLAIPHDVAVLGVDNDPVYCSFSRPKLSSVDPDSPRIGYEAASTLDQMLENNITSTENIIVDIPPLGIVTRASTDTYQGAPDWFGEAIAHINREAVNGLTAAELFKFIGYSRTLIEKTFKNILQTNVKRIIMQTRISEAKRLLKQTIHPIKEIAFQSGFSSPEHFVNTFTAICGVPPGQWRMTHDDENSLCRAAGDPLATTFQSPGTRIGKTKQSSSHE